MLKIAGLSSIHRLLGDGPDDLRTLLSEATGERFRRINRYIELALLGATRCSASAQQPPPPDTALMLCTDIGMLADTTRVLQGIVTRQRSPTPIEFMNLSGSMAGFQMAQHFGLSGVQITLHSHHSSFEAALDLLKLRSAPQRRSLVGYVEEGCWPEAQQRIRLDWPRGALAECSHWLYIDDGVTEPLATLDWSSRHPDLDAVASATDTLDRNGLWLAGSRLSSNTAPVEDWAARLGVTRIYRMAGDAPVYSGGLTAGAICRFVEDHPGQRLLHLNDAGDGALHAVLVTAQTR